MRRATGQAQIRAHEGVQIRRIDERLYVFGGPWEESQGVGKGYWQEEVSSDGTRQRGRKFKSEALQVQLEIRQVPLVWILHRISHYF